jgi:small subunit ribosomal protein S16
MVVIRLTRTGANKRPFYHIVAADSRSPRDGRFIERIGYFNPIARGKEIRLHLDLEKVKAWQVKGAQLSDRMASLVKEAQNPAKAKPAPKKKKVVKTEAAA